MIANIKRLLAVTLLLLLVCSFFAPVAPAMACPAGSEPLGTNSKEGLDEPRVCCPIGSGAKTESCIIAKYVNPTIKVLSVIAGVAAIIGITMGGIQYASSGGDPQKTALGKGKIVKALYGLVAFLFLYSALQFFSPGGISSQPGPVGGTASAATCSKNFLGLKPWFAYLPPDNFSSDCSISDKFQLLGKGTDSAILPIALVIADDLVRIAALVAVAYVIIAGIKLTTSQGEPDKAKQARETIINALIGLVMAVIAAAVVSYIGNKLSK